MNFQCFPRGGVWKIVRGVTVAGLPRWCAWEPDHSWRLRSGRVGRIRWSGDPHVLTSGHRLRTDRSDRARYAISGNYCSMWNFDNVDRI